MPGNSVFAVYLVYGREHEASGLAELGSLSARLFPGRPLEIVIVDNAVEADREETRGPISWISGDNRCHEFTGYERGIAWLQRRRPVDPEAPLVIANDTFHRNYGRSYLRHFTRARGARALREGGILAHLDRYPCAVGIGGLRLDTWARTSLLVLAFQTASRLLPFAVPWSDEAIFGAPFFRPDGPLDETYRQYLSTWLFEPLRPGLLFRHEWHSKEPLTELSRGRLQAKARCILSEHWLSARAQQSGIPLLEARRPLVYRAARRVVRSGLRRLRRDRSAE